MALPSRFVPFVLACALVGAAFLAPTGALAENEAFAGEEVPEPVMDRLAQVELGRRLFFDPAASVSGRRSCASCHDPDHGYSDPRRLSLDDTGVTTRHSQTLLDGAENPSAHRDGEFPTVRDLVRRRIGTSVSPWAARSRPTTLPEIEFERPGFTPYRSPSEGEEPPPPLAISRDLEDFLRSRNDPGTGTLFETEAVASKLQTSGHYREGFTAAYGSPAVTVDRIADAVAAYCKTIRRTKAPVDRFLAGEEDALGAAARRGLALFRGRAGCATCHTMEAASPAFTDYRFHNTGVSWRRARTRHGDEQLRRLGRILKDRRLAEEQSIAKDTRAWLISRRHPIDVVADRGRGLREAGHAHERAFKTPTLRDVAKRPPYMHDGSLRTLEDVVRYYASGCCDEDPHQDPRLKGFQASERDIADLVAFLESLSGAERPGLARTVWPQRAARTTLRLLDRAYRDPQPIANTTVLLIEEGDILPVEGAKTTTQSRVRTDADGYLTFEPGRRTHVRVRVLGDDDPHGGVLVPDSCRRASVALPLRGRVTVDVTFPPGGEAPSMLWFRQRGTADPLVRTGLEQIASNLRATGDRWVRYVGWIRSDVRNHVELDLPAMSDPLRPGKPLPVSLPLQPGSSEHLDLRSFRWRPAAPR